MKRAKKEEITIGAAFKAIESHLTKIQRDIAALERARDRDLEDVTKLEDDLEFVVSILSPEQRAAIDARAEKAKKKEAAQRERDAKKFANGLKRDREDFALRFGSKLGGAT